METMTGIPASEVGRVVQDYIDDGVTRILVELQSDGSYTISTG